MEQAEGKQKEAQKAAMMASLAYLVFFIPLLAGKKGDEFVMYHVKQAIGLVIVSLALQGILAILGWWGFYQLVYLLVWLLRAFWIGLMILGIMNAQKGEKKPLPWIGGYVERL